MFARSRAAHLFLALVSAASLPSAGKAAAAPPAPEGWHAPASATERALDAILKRVDSDDNALENLLGGRDKAKFHRTVDYAPMLTQPLLTAIARTEAALVKKDCGGRYRRGEICGLDYVPVTCAQDSNDSYLYRIEQEGPLAARIAYAWPGDQHTPVATYQLLRRGDRWMIDGIACRDGDRFNMK
jgi:hypothetical protein